MIKTIIKYYVKLVLKINKINFLSNPNVKVGNNFKLGNYTTSLIHLKSTIVIGNKVDIRNFFNLIVGNNAKLNIKDNVFFNNNCSINCLDNIEIGENTLFGENVKLYDHNHRYNNDKVFHQEFSTAPIKIGKNCWLGSNVVVLKGVTIGDNTIIGAGCVIHKDIPSNTVIINKQEHLVKSF